MAKTESTMRPLGTQAPLFSLIDVTTGHSIVLKADESIVASVIMFICNHCPFVKHVNPALVALATDYIPKKIRFIAINSNDVVNYPDDSPENMIRTAHEQNYPFPYVFDETQEVANAYQAACTPDFFIFDSKLSLVYRGQLDDSRPGNQIAPSGSSIRHALECILQNKPDSLPQKPSIGCNIKWK
jgi:thiol-disulfide isomerase/thioredoxin